MTAAPSLSCTHERVPEFARFLLPGKETSAPTTPPSPMRRKPYALTVFPDNDACHSAAFVPLVFPERIWTFGPNVTSTVRGLYNSMYSPVLNADEAPAIGATSLTTT